MEDIGFVKAHYHKFTDKDFEENDIHHLDRMDMPHLYFIWKWKTE